MAKLDAAVRRQISKREMQKHLDYLCSFVRTAGTEGEHRAVQYVVDQLTAWGVPVEVHEFQAYLSNPVAAVVEVVGAERRALTAKTKSFSGATPPQGVTGEVVYVPGGANMFRDFDTIGRLEAIELKGKIVLSEGGGRQNMIAAQQGGAVGYIHMWPSAEEPIHEGMANPVWGTPTIETVGRLPVLPVVTVNHASGDWLREQAQQGPVTVRMITRLEVGWYKELLPVANIPGRSPQFVLAAGHIDSWHLGATDNATGNATCLELARVFWAQRSRLARGVRIAWWPGHSNGRYAGSTWYADHAWQDLYENCVAYINIDSPGPLGATDYSHITAMAENAAFGAGLVSELTGQKVEWERPERAGDQSFWGHGIPSLFMLLSNRPEGQRAQVGGSGMGWWWHTESDTIDKVGMDVQMLDTRIHATAIARLACAPVLPYRLGDLAAEIEELLGSLQAKAQGRFDMTSAIQAGAAFRASAMAFDATAARAGRSERKQAAANEAIVSVLRLMIPVNYTATGPFEHDPAVPLKPLPGLARMGDLSRLEDKPEYGFVKTYLVRQYNRVVYALRAATGILDAALPGVK
jgi:N-acetylated-alpha-linked acidic dipeptidase